jgi:1-acyl-sn-glycerol-3-phosphate acyltransferase
MAATLQRIGRLIGLAGITATAFAEHAATVAWRRDHAARARCQAQWLHRQSRRVAALIRLRIRVRGRGDLAPLLASNHTGYLDIVALGAVMPVRFVAKSEVRTWPWFGWLARCAGSIFIQRRQRRSTLAAGHYLRMAAQHNTRVVIFPEATSSDGHQVLPFHSSLLAVAAEESWPVTPVWIGYELVEGDPAREVCWWGGMTLLPHLWRLLGHKEIWAHIHFGRVLRHWDRKTLAAELHLAVCDMAEGRRPRRQPFDQRRKHHEQQHDPHRNLQAIACRDRCAGIPTVPASRQPPRR